MQKPSVKCKRIPRTALVFTSDEMPGYSRIRRGRGFSFRLPDGALLQDEGERRRILSLAIPPAYEEVWICCSANGHLQATGLDARGRKQYRYHPGWMELAADRKFTLLPEFARSLPKIRSAYRSALKEPELKRDRVIAGIVALLDRTGYRIGNSRYEKENRSFGLTSLHARHVRLSNDHFLIRFRGKSGKEHEAEIGNNEILKLLQDLHDLPGQHLFRYEGEDGECHDIGSSLVNDWIREESGGEFTAKQFRTWKATVLCALELKQSAPCVNETEVRRAIRAAIVATAAQLHHTPSTCQKYYVHPALLRSFKAGQLHRVMAASPPRLRAEDGSARLLANERRVLKLIEEFS